MWRRLRQHREPEEADLAALRSLYAALGPGFPPEALNVFLPDGASYAEEWCVHGRRVPSCAPAADLSNHMLFGMPPSWELTRVELRVLEGGFTKRGDRLKAGGFFFCRPRGTWHSERLPFLHFWTMCAGKVLLFESFLEEFELRRPGDLRSCVPA